MNNRNLRIICPVCNTRCGKQITMENDKAIHSEDATGFDFDAPLMILELPLKEEKANV